MAYYVTTTSPFNIIFFVVWYVRHMTRQINDVILLIFGIFHFLTKQYIALT